jgi:hypothetical protein
MMAEVNECNRLDFFLNKHMQSDFVRAHTHIPGFNIKVMYRGCVNCVGIFKTPGSVVLAGYLHN